VAARKETWEAHPGSIRVLLSNPRWEIRLLNSLAGIGRVMENGEDEEESTVGAVTSEVNTGEEERLESVAKVEVGIPQLVANARSVFINCW
jgi:hypothetical protein